MPGCRVASHQEEGYLKAATVVDSMSHLFGDKDAADGRGPQLDRLAGEIADRLALAALGDVGGT